MTRDLRKGTEPRFFRTCLNGKKSFANSWFKFQNDRISETSLKPRYLAGIICVHETARVRAREVEDRVPLGTNQITFLDLFRFCKLRWLQKS